MPAERETHRSRRPDGGDGLFIVGLVGRAGSGKSAVARVLVADGARVIEADRLGHLVTDSDPVVRAALIAEYGPGVYRADGALDRAQVAARVFSDPAARARLDALTHPRIVERIRQAINDLRRDGFAGVVVVDAALMLDWALERECDAVLAVVAPEPLAVERLMRDRGWSASHAQARLAAQRTPEQYAVAADRVLDNRGSLESLEHAARGAIAALRAARP